MGTRPAPTDGPRRVDVALTGAFLVLSVVQVLWVQPLTYRLPLDLLLTAVWVLPLAWRRVHPVAAAGVWSASIWVPVEGYLLVGYVVAILLFYAVGRWSQRPLAGGLVCAFAIVTGTVGTLTGPEDPVPGLFAWWMVVLAPFGFGLLMRAQERESEERLLAEREAAGVRAAEEERARIVRELHDVVGHEVTLMSIQSEAAAQALARAPERAAEPIAAVRATAHRANRELRAILDLLGEGELPVASDARGLAELVDRASRLGVPTTLTESGEPWRDAPQHWLAVNRIVQECLTNAGKHAPGEEVAVHLAWAPDLVRLEVTNAAPTAPARGTGLGLPGMAERARLLGGSLETSYDGARFGVTACLPAPTATARRT